jgi:Holliday junction resolvase
MKRSASNYERDLLRRLWDSGFVAFRIAGSGSSSFPSADIIAIKDKRAYVFEVKTTRGNKIYLNPTQLWELKRISESGAKVFIAVKFIGSNVGWRFFELNNVIENNKIDLERSQKEGKELQELLRNI